MEDLKEKLIKGIEAFMKEEDTSIEEISGDLTDMTRLFYWLEGEEGIIDFSIAERTDSNDGWLQCDYYSNKLKKVIIIDIDYKAHYENMDELVDKLIETAKEVQAFEDRILTDEEKSMTETAIDYYIDDIEDRDTDNEEQEKENTQTVAEYKIIINKLK